MAATKKRYVLVGGGGHCMSVLDALKASGAADEIGIVDLHPVSVPGAVYLGSDEILPELVCRGWDNAVIALGSVGNAGRRIALYEKLKQLGFAFPPVVDPSAVLAEHVMIKEGTFVGKRAVVNENAQIGICAIINSAAVVEHDCHVGDFCHISPGAVLCGAVEVDEESHIGAGSVLIQGIHVGRRVTIGAGSVVLRNIRSEMVAFGNPCREVKRK